MSTIGTASYDTSEYLMEIIQPTFNKKKPGKYQVKMQVSYDVVNLYPSIPVNKAINVSIDTLNKDKEYLKERT